MVLVWVCPRCWKHSGVDFGAMYRSATAVAFPQCQRRERALLPRNEMVPAPLLCCRHPLSSPPDAEHRTADLPTWRRHKSSICASNRTSLLHACKIGGRYRVGKILTCQNALTVSLLLNLFENGEGCRHLRQECSSRPSVRIPCFLALCKSINESDLHGTYVYSQQQLVHTMLCKLCGVEQRIGHVPHHIQPFRSSHVSLCRARWR